MNVVLALFEQLRRQNFCFADGFTTPLGTLYVAYLRFPFSVHNTPVGVVRSGPLRNQTISTRRPFNSDGPILTLQAHAVEVVLQVEVGLSTHDQLVAAGSGTPATTLMLTPRLVFDLQANAGATNAALIISYVDVEGLPDLPGIDTLRQSLHTHFPAQRIDIDVGKLSGLSGNPPIANIGIATTAPVQLQFVPSEGGFGEWHWIAIRIELGPYPLDTSAWEAFFAMQDLFLWTFSSRGEIPHAGNWGLFTDQVFITEVASQYVDDSFKSSGSFRLQGGIDTAWSAPDGRAIVNLDFYGTAVNACDLGIFGAYDIDVRVNVSIELSIARSTPALPLPPLQQNIKVNTWKSDWDTAFCVLASTITWPYLAFHLMDENKLTWLQYEGSVLIGPVVSIIILAEANKAGSIPAPTQHCTRPDSSKDEFVCTSPFDAGPLAIGGLPRLSGYAGRPDGLVIEGWLSWTQRLGRGFHIASIETHGFALQPVHFNCQNLGVTLAAIHDFPLELVRYIATIVLNFEEDDLEPNAKDLAVSTSAADLIPPVLCDAKILPQDDPLNVFAPHLAVDDSSPFYKVITIDVPAATVPAGYFDGDQHYACRVLITTSSGARIITLPAIVQASDASIQSTAMGAWAQAVSRCYARSKTFDPSWLVDPVERVDPAQEVEHLWNLFVTGVRSGKQIALADGLGRTVVSARADRAGTVRLPAVLGVRAYSGTLQVQGLENAGSTSLRMSASAATKVDAAELLRRGFARVDVTQTRILLLAAVESSGALRMATPISTALGQGLLLTDDTGIAHYDMRDPRSPRLLARMAQTGLAGVVQSGGNLIAFGATGIFACTVGNAELHCQQLSRRPVTAMVVLNDIYLMLAEGRLESWSRARRRLAGRQSEGAHSLAVGADWALVAFEQKADLYSRAELNLLTVAASVDFAGLQGVEPAIWSGRTNSFTLRNQEKAETILVRAADRIETVAEYAAAYMPLTGTRAGNLVIAADQRTGVVRIFAAGRRKQL